MNILNSKIREDVVAAESVTLVKPVNLYGCQLGERTFVGPFVEIQEGVIIGADCRIQSHSFVCSGVEIGNDTFVGHGVMFINDLFQSGDRARGDKSQYKTTNIGSHVNIGSNATILPVNICDGACIGAGSVVTKDIVEAGVYAGNPAKLIRKLSS